MRIVTALIAALALATPALASSRIKDMVDVEDVRENPLVGYGLVVGLDGSGDSLRNSAFTNQSLNAMLEHFNVNTRDANLNTRNVAAVMVTASLPAFSTQGSRIDVTVSAIGDLRSPLLNFMTSSLPRVPLEASGSSGSPGATPWLYGIGPACQ